MSSDELFRLLKDTEKTRYQPAMGIHVSKEGGSVELVLDPTAAIYGEHIPGEGADICLLRCRDTGRVVGVHLPLMNERLVVSHDPELVRINEGFALTAPPQETE